MGLQIIFKSKKLKKQIEGEIIKKTQRGIILQKRLDSMLKCETLEGTRNLPGNFHELHNDRKGEFACSIDEPYRLIFKPTNYSSKSKKEVYIWSEITALTILEIIDYH
jgi:proteic killer suppression protein